MKKIVVVLVLCVVGFTLMYAAYAQRQQEVAPPSAPHQVTGGVPDADTLPQKGEVSFRQVIRYPVGSRPGELALRVMPNREVFAPRLLPPDKKGAFWVMGEVNGGIVRLNRSGQVVTILKPLQGTRSRPSVNSSGQIALHLYSGDYEGVAIYSPGGQKLGEFRVHGCPQCNHSYVETIIGLDNQGRVWLQFHSSDRSVEEDPKLTACAAAFDLQGRLVQHIVGVWGLSAGRLWRRTKSIGGSYIILNPETMKTSEIPVPAGWDGFLAGIDPNRDLIWWRGWRLDDVKVTALIVFGKQGIVATLPWPHNKTLQGAGEEILSADVVIGTDGRLYVTQCGKGGFYICEVDMAFLER
ncbi:MAG: hypothetical protein NZT92_03045 [Abditibacteriales bacterium]|nr:hypothetical protein [Abditibacteriales bacterium]